MNDAELLNAFEDGSLPLDQWTHRAHVRVAYLYASTSDLDTAICRMRASIIAYNQATSTPEAINRGYHETITQAFMRLVFAANIGSGPHTSSDDFCDAHPQLLTSRVLQDYYSPECLTKWLGKTHFIEPDRQPLP